MSLLFSPLRVRNVDIRNRLWVSPMCMYSAEDGIPNDWHHVHLSQFAAGGAGLIMAEATAVVPEGRISPRDTGLWNDEQRDAWRGIVDSVHARGAAVGVQLAHAGRKASTWWPWADARGSVPFEDGGWQTVAPSAIGYPGLTDPLELDEAGIDRVITGFVDAAARAVDAGFDLVEIHAAHGYLVHEFLSPLTNTREDSYGGDLRGRARLLLRIVAAVRATVGEGYPVFVRFSGSDFAEGGWNEADTAIVAGWAREAGADLFDISGGGLVREQRITVGPGYQVPLAAHVRREADVLVAAVGMLTDGAQAEAVLAAGDADAIFAGREWLRDSHFALTAAADLGLEGGDPAAPWPRQYQRAAL